MALTICLKKATSSNRTEIVASGYKITPKDAHQLVCGEAQLA